MPSQKLKRNNEERGELRYTGPSPKLRRASVVQLGNKKYFKSTQLFGKIFGPAAVTLRSSENLLSLSALCQPTKLERVVPTGTYLLSIGHMNTLLLGLQQRRANHNIQYT